MQTFLPYADFAATAAVLDPRRLGKQRVEALQIVRAVTVPGYGWRHHPAARMWRGYEEALGAYGVAICREWCRRGHADTCDAKIRAELAVVGLPSVRGQAELAAAGALPPWLGDEDFHRSHRSSLLTKDADWYGAIFTDVPPGLPYLWPDGPPPAGVPPSSDGAGAAPLHEVDDPGRAEHLEDEHQDRREAEQAADDPADQ